MKVEDFLDSASTNPVQNWVIYDALANISIDTLNGISFQYDMKLTHHISIVDHWENEL